MAIICIILANPKSPPPSLTHTQSVLGYLYFFFIQKEGPNEYVLTENIKEEKSIDSGIKVIA